jgi:hypothetical protein
MPAWRSARVRQHQENHGVLEAFVQCSMTVTPHHRGKPIPLCPRSGFALRCVSIQWYRKPRRGSRRRGDRTSFEDLPLRWWCSLSPGDTTSSSICSDTTPGVFIAMPKSSEAKRLSASEARSVLLYVPNLIGKIFYARPLVKLLMRTVVQAMVVWHSTSRASTPVLTTTCWCEAHFWLRRR